MADTNEAAVMDTGADTPAPDSQASGTPPAGADTGAAETLLAGKYKSPQELERAYKESQAAMTKAQQEAADARRRAELAETQASVAQAIREGLSGLPQGRDDERVQRERAELIERLQREGEAGTVDFVANFVRTSHAKTQDALMAALQKELKDRDAKLNQVMADLTEIKETSDPVFQTNREQIESMMREDGLTRKQAISAIRKLKPQVAPALDADGGMAQRRGGNGGPKAPPKTDAEVEAEVREILTVAPDMTAAEITELRARLKGVRK